MSEWSSRYPYTDNNVNLYVPASEGVYRLIYKKVKNITFFMWGKVMIYREGLMSI